MPPSPHSPTNSSLKPLLSYEKDSYSPPWRSDLIIFVNGILMKPKNLIHLTPTTSLLSFLRANGLTGTKLGCNEGGCGACTVILQKWTGEVVESRSVNACLFPAVGAEGGNVVTVEGLGSLRGGMHPVQERMTKVRGKGVGGVGKYYTSHVRRTAISIIDSNSLSISLHSSPLNTVSRIPVRILHAWNRRSHVRYLCE